MYVVSFDILSISGDSHYGQIVCATEVDAQKILTYILAHDEDIYDTSIEKYEPPVPETFESWVEQFGKYHEDRN